MAFEILEEYDACDGHRVEVLVNGTERRTLNLAYNGAVADVPAAVQEILDREAAEAAAMDWTIVED